MTDNELLLQISNIVTSNSKFLEYRIDQLDEKLSNRMDLLEKKIDNVELRLSSDIADIRRDINDNIKPRLQNIESCYIDTNQRHNANIEKIESIQQNMEVVQSVLQDHIEYINQQTA